MVGGPRVRQPPMPVEDAEWGKPIADHAHVAHEALAVEEHELRGVRDGLPLLSDGTVLDVANVIWCGECEPQPEPISMPELY